MKSKRFDLLLIIGFSLLVIMLFIISYVSVSSLAYTNDLFNDSFNHSLKIKEAVQNANTDVIAVHRAMKDVALSRNQTQLKEAMGYVDFYNAKVLENLQEVKNIEGKSNVLLENAYKAYIDWKPIRQITIQFALKGQYDMAAENTRKKGAIQVDLISSKMEQLLNQVSTDANNSYQTANTASQQSTIFLFVLSVFYVLLGVIISSVIIRRLIVYRNILFKEKELHRVTIDSIGDGVITVDLNRKVKNINKVAQEYTGWEFEKAVDMKFSEVLQITNERTGDKAKDPVEQVLTTDQICELENHTILTSLDGTKRHIADSAAPIKDINDNTVGVVMVFRDVTEKKKHLDEIRFLSYHDGLTGLYNRNYFIKEMHRFDSEEYLPLSIIMGDVNGLKLSNDVYGHETGDSLLINISEILINNCRESDIVSRIGGDEFAIILPNTSMEESNLIQEKIKASCEESNFRTENFKAIILSISLGSNTRDTIAKSMDLTYKNAEDRMYTHKLLEGKSVRSTIISSLKNSLFERSCETEIHAERIMQISIDLGEKIGLSKYEMDEMKLLSLLHDIGKIGVSDNILNKPGMLTDDEWVEMKKHPEIGYRIAQATPELAHISELILTHHERWDGKGYPQGLSDENIPKLSRMLSIIDAFDVMTHGRPYWAKSSLDEALAEIRSCAGTQFDPNISRVFVEKVLGMQWEI